MARHAVLSFANGIHILPNWTFANAAALAAFVPPADGVLKAAYQQDTQTLWLLVQHSPPIWKALTGAEDLAADVVVLETNVSTLQTDVDAAEAAIATNASGIGANTSSITALQTSLAAAQRGWAGKRTFTAADSAQLPDAGRLLYSNVGAAHDFTLQPNSSVPFTATDVVSVLQKGAGPFTVKGGSGVTPIPPPGKTLTSKGVGALVSMTPDPSNLNIWNVYGDLA